MRTAAACPVSKRSSSALRPLRLPVEVSKGSSVMANPIELYFDFSSPYGYFATTQIEALAAKHGREVLWRPSLMGAALKVMNAPPNVHYPLKGDYVRHDFARTARWLGVPFKLPQPFPVATVGACRAYHWAEGQDPNSASER